MIGKFVLESSGNLRQKPTMPPPKKTKEITLLDAICIKNKLESIEYINEVFQLSQYRVLMCFSEVTIVPSLIRAFGPISELGAIANVRSGLGLQCEISGSGPVSELGSNSDFGAT